MLKQIFTRSKPITLLFRWFFVYLHIDFEVKRIFYAIHMFWAQFCYSQFEWRMPHFNKNLNRLKKLLRNVLKKKNNFRPQHIHNAYIKLYLQRCMQIFRLTQWKCFLWIKKHFINIFPCKYFFETQPSYKY